MLVSLDSLLGCLIHLIPFEKFGGILPRIGANDINLLHVSCKTKPLRIVHLVEYFPMIKAIVSIMAPRHPREPRVSLIVRTSLHLNTTLDVLYKIPVHRITTHFQTYR